MRTSQDLATDGLLNSPIAAATEGMIRISLIVIPPDRPNPPDGGSAGGVTATTGFGSYSRRMARRREEEDFIEIAVRAILFLMKGE